MADFYKQGGSYFTTSGQKVANPTELQNLARAGGKEIAMPSVPTGATKIASPDQLKGLTEKDIFRQGQDIYRLPSINTTLDAEQVSPDVPVPEQIDDVSSLMAGLDTSNKGTEAILKEINKPLPQEKEITETQKRAGELSEEKAKVQETALPTAEEFGYTKYTKELQSILPQIASLKAQYDNAEIAQEGRKGLAGSIYGRQALIQRQRAIELQGLSAIAQAYQGNIQLATQTAKDMIDMELAPIQTRIDDQKWQIEQVYEQLTSAEQKKADSLNLVLAERERLLEEEKERKMNIANVGLVAAQNGADQATIEKIMNATDYMKAIKLASEYLDESQGTWEESEITDANGNPLLFNSTTGEYKNSVGTSTSDIFFTDANGDSWNIAGWATDQTKPQQMDRIAKQIGKVTEENIDEKVKEFTPGLTADMIKEASSQSGVSWEAIMTMVVQEAQGGLSNVAKNNNNFGGLTWSADTQWQQEPYNGTKGTERPEGGNYTKFPTKQQGLNAMAALMAQYGKVEPKEPVVTSAQNWADMIASGRAELSNVPTDERTDVVNALVLTPSVKDTTDDLVAKQKAQMALSLQDHNGLNNAVGTIKLGRYAPFQWGQKQDFIASVEQLVSGLSLEALVEAKSRGATFGALSDREMRILSSSATKIGTWTMRDSTGRVTGYKARESDMRAELQNIANILTRGLKDTTINQLDNNIMTSTPIMTGQTSSGMGYQVIE